MIVNGGDGDEDGDEDDQWSMRMMYLLGRFIPVIPNVIIVNMHSNQSTNI